MLLIRLSYRLKLIYQTLLFKIGFEKKLLKNRYGERILVFHGIDLKGETKYNSRFISKSYFEEFIIYLKKNYNIISLEDFYAEKFKKDTLNIAITFDDGYLNNYKYAIPILEKHQIPASFYITTIHDKSTFLWADYIDLVSYYTSKKEIFFNNKNYTKNKKNEFSSHGESLKDTLKTLEYTVIEDIYNIFKDDWSIIKKNNLEDYWQLMTNKQIEVISKNKLFTIGAHADTHTSLTAINLNTAKREINLSKKKLENICNQPITEFAFPFGFYNKKLIAYCKSIGFKKILLVDFHAEPNFKETTTKKRFVINPYISLRQQIAYILKGTYI